MTLFLLWTLAHFGLAYVVGHSVITLPFRTSLWAPNREVLTLRDAQRVFLVTLLECPACFGFWAGGVAIVFVAPFVGAVRSFPPYVLAPAFALATSGSNYLLARLAGLIPPAIASDVLPADKQADLYDDLRDVNALEARIEEVEKRIDKALRSYPVPSPSSSHPVPLTP